MKTFVLVTGRKRSGKDTFARYLARQLGCTYHSISVYVHEALARLLNVDASTIDRLKEKSCIKFKGRKIPLRQLLQRLGTEVGRQMINPEVWLSMLEKDLDDLPYNVISGIRFHNEVAFFEKKGITFVCEVEQEGQVFKSDTHISEDGLPVELIDFQVRASSLSELEDEASRVAEVVRERRLVEMIAALEHEQWAHWSRELAKQYVTDLRPYNFMERKIRRWRFLWCSYMELGKGARKLDREWARKVVNLLKSEGVLK